MNERELQRQSTEFLSLTSEVLQKSREEVIHRQQHELLADALTLALQMSQ